MSDLIRSILRNTSLEIDRLCFEFLKEYPSTEIMVTWVYLKGHSVKYGVGTHPPDEAPEWAVSRYRVTPSTRDEFLLAYEAAHEEPR